MKKTAYVGLVALLTGCMIVQARTSHTGHFVITLTDRETGLPVTNATAKVRVQTKFGLSYTLDSFYTTVDAMTDANGVADVEFEFYSSSFDWWVKAPSHYSGGVHGGERFRREVVKSDYLDIDTNTVDGLTKYNELKSLHDSGDMVGYLSKFEPKSVTYTENVVYRSASLYPKHNPQPMYAHAPSYDTWLPVSNELFASNGMEIVHWTPVDLDMKDCLLLPYSEKYDKYWDGPAGTVSDFHLERFSVTTNEVTNFFGWMEFAPGCGAYIRKTTGDKSFPMTYEADTNETFVSRIPFEYHSVSGKVTHVKKLLADDEYMVLRTRVMTNSVGVVTNCNYSKILGPMTVQDELEFETMIFNPQPNDPNLECDLENNLARRRKCNWYP